MEQADTTYMVRLSDGREFGPARIALLEEWARQRRIPLTAQLVPQDGGPAVSVGDLPALAQIVNDSLSVSTPPAAAPRVAQSGIGAPPPDYSGVIPYRNAPALIGYYLAVFSLIPLVGAVLGMAAVILGAIGLRQRARNPQIKGMAHALIALVGGGIMTLVWGAVVLLIIIAAASEI